MQETRRRSINQDGDSILPSHVFLRHAAQKHQPNYTIRSSLLFTEEAHPTLKKKKMYIAQTLSLEQNEKHDANGLFETRETIIPQKNSQNGRQRP